MRLGLIGSTGHWQTYAPALRHVPELTLVAVAAAGPEETTGAFDHAPGLTVDQAEQALRNHARPAASSRVLDVGDAFAAVGLANNLAIGRAGIPRLATSSDSTVPTPPAEPSTSSVQVAWQPPGVASAPSPTSRSVMTSSVGAGPSKKSISGLLSLLMTQVNQRAVRRTASAHRVPRSSG